MAFSAEQQKLYAMRVDSATSNMANNCENIISSAEIVSSTVNGDDASAAKLAGEWKMLAEQYSDVNMLIKNLGSRLSKALKNYASKTVENEEASSIDIKDTSEKIQAAGAKLNEAKESAGMSNSGSGKSSSTGGYERAQDRVNVSSDSKKVQGPPAFESIGGTSNPGFASNYGISSDGNGTSSPVDGNAYLP